jgi:hypothetical protein
MWRYDKYQTYSTSFDHLTVVFLWLKAMHLKRNPDIVYGNKELYQYKTIIKTDSFGREYRVFEKYKRKISRGRKYPPWRSKRHPSSNTRSATGVLAKQQRLETGVAI